MSQKPILERGAIVLVLFPNSNLRTAKPRPAIIVQADRLRTGLQQVVVAMITSRLIRSGHPSRVVIRLSTPEGQQSGLLSDSVIMTDNLATIAHSEINRIVGVLSMVKVDEALRHTLEL